MRKTLIFLIAVVLVSSCYKDSDKSTVVKKERPPHIVINGEIYGDYIKEDGSASSQLSIKSQDELYSFEDGEIPIISLNRVKKQGQFVELFDNGARVGAAQLTIIENDLNYVKLVVDLPFEKQVIALSDQIQLGSGISLGFTNVALVTETGSPYEKQITAEYHHTNSDHYNQQLLKYAFDKLGNRVVVDVGSSFYIGLLSDSEESLNLGTGELEVMSDPGSSHSLFHFNENEETWDWVSDFASGLNSEKLESLGWYALGTSRLAIFIEGTIQSDNVEVVKQGIRLQSGDFTRKVYSTASGRFSGFVPAKENIDLSIVTNDGVELQSQKFNSEDDKVDINLPPEIVEKNFLKSDFEVISCDGIVEEEKILNIAYPNGSSERIAFPKYQRSWFPTDGSTFIISAGDGPEVPWNTETGAIHYLSNCSDHKEGFTLLKIRQDRKVFPAFTETKLNNRTVLAAPNNEVRIIIEASQKGSYGEEYINLSIDDEAFGSNGYFLSCENAENGCGIEICEISHYKEDGDEWNRLYFKGEIWMQTISPAQVGNFDVEGYILSKQ